jgi:predicted  nucleic acid-binding Zn-ribbon protein
MWSRADFSKILELIELRNSFTRMSGELDRETDAKRQAITQLEEDIKRAQLNIRKIREYINDGQKRLDTMEERYAPMLALKDQKIQQLKVTLERIEREFK